MPEVTVKATVSDAMLHRYEDEARREGVPVEQLLAQTVNCLIREMEEEEDRAPCDPS